MTKPMTTRAHVKAVLSLGLPLIGSNLGLVAIGITDTVMLGWYSVEALAASVLGHTFFFSVYLLGTGFGWAVLPMVAEASEHADSVRKIRRVTRMAMWLSVLFSIVVLPFFYWSGGLLRAVGQDEALAIEAQTYLRLLGLAMGPALLGMVLKSYLAALERTQVVFWVTIIAALVNALVNYVLIFGNFGAPELGIKGAAWASMSVHVVSAVLMVLYALRVFRGHNLLQRIWRPDWQAMGQVFRVGMPIGITYLSETGMFAMSAVMLGWLGTIPLAAHGIALQIASATFVVHLGLSSAATVRAGKALGRQDFDHLRLGAWVATLLSVAFAVFTVLFYWGIPGFLIGLFIDPTDPLRPEIIAAGIGLMIVAGIFQLFDGAQAIALSLLRGLSDTQIPMIYAALSYWLIGIPASYVLGFTLGFGGVGVWLGLVVGLGFAAVLLMARFWWRLLPRVAAAAPPA